MLPELSISNTASTPDRFAAAKLAEATETSSTRVSRYLKYREKWRRRALDDEILFMPVHPFILLIHLQ
jgi:hypothetical protein